MLTTPVPQSGRTPVASRDLLTRKIDQRAQMGTSALPLRRLNDAVRCVRIVSRGHALYRPGDTFRNIYAIRTGSFKSVVMHRDGREQVTGFGIVGDTLGIDGIASGRHNREVIALEDSSVCVMSFPVLEMLCREVKTLQHHVHQMLGAEIVRESTLMMLLGTASAEERVAAFLNDLSQRWQARGYSAAAFTLKMTRGEIGSYLGLKLETISRMLTKLQRRRLIEVHGKDVRILDIDGLQMRATDVCIPPSGLNWVPADTRVSPSMRTRRKTDQVSLD